MHDSEHGASSVSALVRSMVINTLASLLAELEDPSIYVDLNFKVRGWSVT